ncbi:hypothetical protein GWI33_006997 [Rhynchophorus ferrugineus]|uniref:Uncharacterized protein n=1 Tax=Rhynchophorus ferrugineus TaxID=354439 RepID=A0A834IE48_RHYFE|nr:hypothetical protein GWI33_006997 [Rhynchophorus ferrugineus]
MKALCPFGGPSRYFCPDLYWSQPHLAKKIQCDRPKSYLKPVVPYRQNIKNNNVNSFSTSTVQPYRPPIQTCSDRKCHAPTVQLDNAKGLARRVACWFPGFLKYLYEIYLFGLPLKPWRILSVTLFLAVKPSGLQIPLGTVPTPAPDVVFDILHSNIHSKGNITGRKRRRNQCLMPGGRIARSYWHHVRLESNNVLNEVMLQLAGPKHLANCRFGFQNVLHVIRNNAPGPDYDLSLRIPARFRCSFFSSFPD